MKSLLKSVVKSDYIFSAYNWVTTRKNMRVVALGHYRDQLVLSWEQCVAGEIRNCQKVFTDVNECLEYALTRFKIVL